MKITNNVAKEIKKDFPIFQNNHNLVYLDNSATTQKPKQVINSITNYYENYNANIHRGIYEISEISTKLYEESKKSIANLINSKTQEIIFTRGTTESLNLIAYSLERYLKNTKKEQILITEFEHHSNLVTWQQLSQRLNLKLEVVKINENYNLDLEDLKNKINKKTAIFAFTHISNSLGTKNPAKELIKIGKENDAITIIDCAQSIPHQQIDFQDLDCDFLAFSGHKMLGPMGIGVLCGKYDLLEKIPPFQFGGDMISNVTFQKTTWNKIPMKFEAGTPNVAGAVGLKAAAEYLEKIGLENISEWEKELSNYAYEKLKNIKKIKIFRTDKQDSTGIISFIIDGIHHHDIAEFLSKKNICVRVGHHCTMPLMDILQIKGTIRISLYLYNTYEDIDVFIEELKNAVNLFS